MGEMVPGNLLDFILLAVGIIILVSVLILYLFPSASAGIQNVALNLKKPFCCQILQCKPAVQQTTENPGGGFACVAFCAGVCG